MNVEALPTMLRFSGCYATSRTDGHLLLLAHLNDSVSETLGDSHHPILRSIFCSQYCWTSLFFNTIKKQLSYYMEIIVTLCNFEPHDPPAKTVNHLCKGKASGFNLS